MTFLDEALKPASERFFVVRITARKYAGTGSHAGGGVYYFGDLPAGLNINQVLVNGVVEPVWSYESTGNPEIWTIAVTSSTDLTLASNVMTIDHDIFLTGTKIRETASVAGLPNATWEPLIENYPTFSQSMRNITEGVFSLSNTDLTVICTNRWAQKFLGTNDSFSAAPVSVWVCIDEVTNNRKIFDGEVSNVSYSYGKLNLSVIDSFNRLKQSAIFGSVNQAFNNRDNGRTPNLAEPDVNSAATLVIGKTSPLIMDRGYRISSNFRNPNDTISGPLNVNFFHLKDGLRCIPVTANYESADSVQFYVGRFVGTNIKRLTFGSVVRAHTAYVEGNYEVYDPDFLIQAADYHKITMVNFTNFNGEIGDYVPGLGFCCCKTQFSHAGLTYNCAFGDVQYYLDSSSGNVGQPVSISAPSENVYPSMSIWCEGTSDCSYQYGRVGSNWFLKPKYSGRYVPFSLQLGTPYSFGGQQITDVFVTVLKSDIGDDYPGKLTFKARFSPSTELTHGNLMKFIIKSAGMLTNDATFSQADSELPANVALCVPYYLSSGYPKYLEVAQLVASSTLGILRINQNREIEYELIKNVSSAAIDSTKNILNMISGDTTTSLEYQDIVSNVTFKNENLVEYDKSPNTGATATVYLPINEQLHRAKATKEINHVLTNIQGRKDAIAGYLSNPTVEYTLSTASEDLASSIGDVVEITNPCIADSGEVAVGVIIGLDQSGSKTSVKINEIRGVS